jgi:hypothetical protein
MLFEALSTSGFATSFQSTCLVGSTVRSIKGTWSVRLNIAISSRASPSVLKPSILTASSGWRNLNSTMNSVYVPPRPAWRNSVDNAVVSIPSNDPVCVPICQEYPRPRRNRRSSKYSAQRKRSPRAPRNPQRELQLGDPADRVHNRDRPSEGVLLEH